MWVSARLWVERKLIIDGKAVEGLNDVHLAQVLTYLRLDRLQVGTVNELQRPTPKGWDQKGC
jgi:GxxExxY protein